MTISTRKFGPFHLQQFRSHASRAGVLAWHSTGGFSLTLWSNDSSGSVGFVLHDGDRSVLSIQRLSDNGYPCWKLTVNGRPLPPAIRRPLHRIRAAFHRVRGGATAVAAMYWPPGPIYVRRFSRDCDLCEREWVTEFPSRYAMLRDQEHAYEWAEGPEHYDVISEAEYNHAIEYCPNGSFRDRAAEMMGY